ncbi:hypothetical protein B0675_40100 [Streptomyces sp. M41(2017)]|uniref:hypothetical protein n=1 Tax=Streptomyces sp. M41(2017) TaxID=1955065 RepID=UPI0009BFAED4|nr:hypothetical protein [Streptomyces sp. M41(2017)]OQQ13023.1 hypothetical protein B0675_40100 [Streptomyces sp. M41(2017)]
MDQKLASPLTNPQTEATHYGISVCNIGEDGDMLALGHPGDRRALAAFNRHARVFIGLCNLADDPRATLSEWVGSTQEKWVIFRKPDPEQGEDPDYVWVCDDADASTPGALPVTVLVLN